MIATWADMRRSSNGNGTTLLDYLPGTWTAWIKRWNTWRSDPTYSDYHGVHLGSGESLRGEWCCHVSLTFLIKKFSAVRFGGEDLVGHVARLWGSRLGAECGRLGFRVGCWGIENFCCVVCFEYFNHLNLKISGVVIRLPAWDVTTSPLQSYWMDIFGL